MLAKKAISEKLESMFGKEEASLQDDKVGRDDQRMTELSKQAIEGVDGSVGGAWKKVIWQW